MTLFRVHCPTCQARLKVTSRSLIGQIVNCPKCGSMVEIAEPGDSDPKPRASSKSKPKRSESKPTAPPATAAPASMPADDPAFADTRPAEMSASDLREAAVDVSNSDEVFDNIDEMLDAESTTPTAKETPPPIPTDAAASKTPPPLDSGRFSHQASVSKMRNMALIGGTAVMALVTIGVIGYTVLSEGDTPPHPANDPAQQQIAQAEDPAVEPAVAEVTESDEKEQDVTPPDVAEEGAEGDDPADPSSTDGSPKSETIADEVSPTETPEEATASEQPMKTGEENPFIFEKPEVAEMSEAESPSSEGEKSGVAASSPSVLELKDDPLYEVFGESFPIFDPDAIEVSAANNSLAADPDSAPVAEPPPVPELVPPIPEVDVAARLGDPILRIEFKDMPLNEFTSFVTQMSTVPVTLDPLALHYADIEATKPISIQKAQTSVEGILEAAVRPFGLEVVATEHSARLRITQPLDGHQRTMRLDVADLANDPKEVADLAYLLTHLVEPLSWNHSRGEGLYRLDPGAIMITQNEVAHFKSMVFLEMMRAARGLQPGASPSAPKEITVTPRSEKLAPALEKPMNLQIVVPTPMYKVIDQLEKKSGITILCDWDSLSLNKLGPATPVTMSAQNVTSGEALDRFCRSWKLAALPINENTVQLVAEASVPVMPWLEFYDVGSLELSKSQATAMIHDAERQLGDFRKTGYGEVLYDPVSKHLLALLSRADHQRLRAYLRGKLFP